MQKKILNKIINVVLSGKTNCEVCNSVSLEYLKSNVLVKRLNCHSCLSVKNEVFFNFYNDYSQRIVKQDELIQKISLYLSNRNIPHYFPKAYQHYPDMGNDIDLFINTSKKNKSDFINFFNLKKDSSSLLNRLAGKSAFVYQNSIPIEIHYNVGHFGEFKQLTVEFYRNLAHERNVQQLSNEDKIINQIVQRFYGHFTIRLSDILYTIKILNKGVDYDEIICKSLEYGILDASKSYLGFIIHNFRNFVDSESIKKFGNLDNCKFIYEGKLVFHIDKKYVTKFYFLKFYSDLKNFRLFSMCKIILSPIIFISIITRNLIK